VQKKRENKERRSLLFESISKCSLKPEEMSLLYGSGALGHKLTAKEQATRALRSERLGIDPVETQFGATSRNASLYTSSGSRVGGAADAKDGDADGDDADGDDDDDEDEDGYYDEDEKLDAEEEDEIEEARGDEKGIDSKINKESGSHRDER
jgi:hypothetical protein